jgi:putative ABC transport system permease protein
MNSSEMPNGQLHKRHTGTTAISEAFRIAVDSLWTHKLRSLLTLLGIIIGVASVVTVGGAIGGLGSYISTRLSSVFAGNTFLVARIAMARSYEEYERLLKKNKRIYIDDMQAVEDRCEGCEAVSPMVGGRDDVKFGDKTFYDASISGVNSDFPRIQSIDLGEGRFLSDLEVTHARAAAVIGYDIRSELFGTTNPIGKEIKIGGDSFTVVGVEVQNGSMMGQSLDSGIYIPYTSFLKKYGGANRSISFRVRAPSEAALASTQDEVRVIMRTRHKLKPNKEDDFDILASSAVQDMIGQFTGAIAMVVTPITLISLVVGGIVVMNIMLVTVTERTVEIGTRKAVGARRSDILLQFLVESALLASMGGVIGIILSYILAAVIAGTTPVPMHITVGYILIAIVTSGGIGIISGIYPAHKASKLSPIVALMRE